MTLRPTPIFDELRQRLKDQAKRDDILVLMAWLLIHFADDGSIRSPQSARRKTIALDGVTYWLVRVVDGPGATSDAESMGNGRRTPG